MSIDHDMCFSFVLLMVGHRRPLMAVDWSIAMMCHNVNYCVARVHCLAVDNSGVWSGLSWCGR